MGGKLFILSCTLKQRQHLLLLWNISAECHDQRVEGNLDSSLSEDHQPDTKEGRNLNRWRTEDAIQGQHEVKPVQMPCLYKQLRGNTENPPFALLGVMMPSKIPDEKKKPESS